MSKNIIKIKFNFLFKLRIIPSNFEQLVFRQNGKKGWIISRADADLHDIINKNQIMINDWSSFQPF
jgi:hypothetical protein